MKKMMMLFALVCGGLFTAPVFAQVPVTDIALNTQTTMNQVENIAKWMESINQYKMQIEQMKQQYESLTGSRGMGEIMNNPQFRDYLPNDWQGVYDSVRGGGYSGLTGSAKAIREANSLYNGCAGLTGQRKTVCERSASKGAQDKAFASDAFDKATDRLNQIQQLMGQINSTTDPKAIAELQARIASEQAAIQNESTKLQMYQMIAVAEDKLIEQQKRDLSSKEARNRGYIDLSQPIEQQ